MACANLPLECCKFLVEAHIDFGTLGSGLSARGNHPFLAACATGSLELVEYLYKQFPEAITRTTPYTNSYEKSGNKSALHLAVSSEHKDRRKIIQFLLSQNCGLAKFLSQNDSSALHSCATCSIDLDIMRDVFYKHPEAIYQRDNEGRMPIHLAFLSTKGSTESQMNNIRFLIEQLPFSPSAEDLEGRVCAHYACRSRSGVIPKLKLIQEKWPMTLLHVSRVHGMPIHDACCSGCELEVIDHLAGLDPKSLEHEHPEVGLPLACVPLFDRHYLFVDLLMRRYSKVKNKGTALFCALLKDEEVEMKGPIISRFLACCNPIFHKDGDKVTNYCGEIEKRTGRYALHYLVQTVDNISDVREAIKYFPSALKHQDKNGNLPLHLALANAPYELINLLVNEYPDGKSIQNKQGMTPLHIASRYRDFEKLETLAANCNAAMMLDKNGCTPLHIACKSGLEMEWFTILMSLGKEALRVRDTNGDLPLHKACRTCWYTEMVDCLIAEDPASVSVRNFKAELPVFLLCKKTGKPRGLIKKGQYTELVWKMLTAYPETMECA